MNFQNTNNKFKIVLSVGEESGIGPEIILKALCSDEIPETGLDVLTQHGMDNIMAAPSGWSKKVDKHYGPKN